MTFQKSQKFTDLYGDFETDEIFSIFICKFGHYLLVFIPNLKFAAIFLNFLNPFIIHSSFVKNIFWE